MSVFSFLSKEKWRGPEQVLSQHEVEKEIRETSLDMFYYGVKGSKLPISREAKERGQKIPTLLRYSKNTCDHFQTLIGVLDAPREFQITEKPNGGWRSNEPDGDVIYEPDEYCDKYEFANYLTAPYLNSFGGIFDGFNNQKPILSVHLDAFKDGVWKLGYTFFTWEPFTLYDAEYVEGNYSSNKRIVGMDILGINPEKEFLLNFIFAPGNLEAKWFIEHSFSKKDEKYLKDLGTKKVGPFEVKKIGFDALSSAKDFKKRDGFILGELNTCHSLEIYSLEKEGNREFGIVNLGKAEIGNVSYHIYSASEQPFVYEEEQSLNPKTQLVLQPSFIRVT